MFWKWFHLIITMMFALASFQLVFEEGALHGFIGLVLTYLYWQFIYCRSARKALRQDNLGRFVRENGITPNRMVKGPNLIIAINSAANRLFAYRYLNHPYASPTVFGQSDILEVKMIELTETQKEEAGGWTAGFIGAALGGGLLGFLLGFLLGWETRRKTVVTGYRIKITVRNATNPVYYLNFDNRGEAERWRGLLMVVAAGGK
jgi:hypothetical protein